MFIILNHNNHSEREIKKKHKEKFLSRIPCLSQALNVMMRFHIFMRFSFFNHLCVNKTISKRVKNEINVANACRIILT